MTEQHTPGEVRVTVTTNGPYRATGSVPVVRKRIVDSEHGESIAWQTLEHLPVRATAVLCRCGGSAAKPYCDGTHRANGFDGTESAPTSRYEERAKSYQASGFTLQDDRGICEHAGFCTNRVTTVWKMVKSGATADSITRAQVLSMVEHCPSGALTVRLDGDDPQVTGRELEPDLAVGVGVVDDGPLFVTGGVEITRADGEPLERRNRVTLCRCGGSQIKPLCDGTHREIGFRDHYTPD
jgi:CDGSH-type Zn-finger protein